ncbi:MAG: RAMP superfamily CRISPR-associated protein [Hyphomicrobiaceae bacterium]
MPTEQSPTIQRSQTLKIDLRNYWHCSGGRGLGPHLDAICIKNDLGLPFVPGKTVRGLLRHAVVYSLMLRGQPPNLTEWIFGTDGFVGGVARSDTKPGRIRVDGAIVTESLSNALQKMRDAEAKSAADERRAINDVTGPLTTELFRVLRMTAIDEGGVARNRTLRSIEVAIPQVLTSTISLTDAAEDSDAVRVWHVLSQAAPLIRGIGAFKARGLGRVSCTIDTTDNMAIAAGAGAINVKAA